MLQLRAVTPADADALAATVLEGFATYREFAPEGWAPPDHLELALGLAARLSRPSVRGWLAEEDGAPVGHVTFLPATESQQQTDEPGLAHLEQLFVRRAHWGGGSASLLHDRAVEAARDDGYAEMRLATPIAHARARRFYERAGWTAVGAPFVAQPLGLELVEYRRGLDP